MKTQVWKFTILSLVTVVTPCNIDQTNLLASLKVSHRNKTSSISERDLAQYLFQNYSADCRPRKDAAQEVNVAIGFSIYAVNEIIERTHEIIITASLAVQWWDEFLVWENVPPYNEIKFLAYPGDKVWLPDIALTNSGDLYAFMKSRGMLVEIHRNGFMEYFPEATVTSFCWVDLTFFPFDKQVCEFRFESWSYVTWKQTFKLVQPAINLKRFGRNEHWEVIRTDARNYTACYNYTVTRTYCYPGVEFKLFLERKSVYYAIMIIVPSLIFSLVELVSFSLPLAEVSKLQITFTCLLSYSVFQTTARTDMPRTSEHDPLLSLYFDLQMGFIAFALFGQAAVFIALEQAFGNSPVPKLLSFLFAIPHTKAIFQKDQFELDLNVKETKTTTTTKRMSEPSSGGLLILTEGKGLHTAGEDNVFVSESNLKKGSVKKRNRRLASRRFSVPYPGFDILRNKIKMHSIFRRNSTFRHPEKTNVEKKPRHRFILSPRERMKWHILATRIEKFVIYFYSFAIIVTPIYMFYIARVINPDQELDEKTIHPDDRH